MLYILLSGALKGGSVGPGHTPRGSRGRDSERRQDASPLGLGRLHHAGLQVAEEAGQGGAFPSLRGLHCRRLHRWWGVVGEGGGCGGGCVVEGGSVVEAVEWKEVDMVGC